MFPLSPLFFSAGATTGPGIATGVPRPQMRAVGVVILGDGVVEVEPDIDISVDDVFALELLLRDGKFPPIYRNKVTNERKRK